MRPIMVVMFDLLPNNDLGFSKTVENLSIKKVIPKGAVEALTKAILPRAAPFSMSAGFDSNGC